MTTDDEIRLAYLFRKLKRSANLPSQIFELDQASVLVHLLDPERLDNVFRSYYIISWLNPHEQQSYMVHGGHLSN